MKQKSPLYLIFALLLVTTVAEAGIEAQTEKVGGNIATFIEDFVENYDLPSIAVGIVSRNGLVWTSGFGFADHDKSKLVDENTLYRVGSLAKLFTASAILQLEENSRIDLDQALSEQLSGFSYRSRFSSPGVITPRHLLTHHSGLPSNINKGFWTDERFTGVVARLRDEYIAYPVDFIHNYSNVGYSLLGTLIEERAETSFESYMQQNILAPLGMDNTEFSQYTNGSFAEGHKNGRSRPNLAVRDLPALGLNTNVNDLAKFLSTILAKGKYQNKQLLSQQSVESMFQAQNRNVALDFDQLVGLPWMLRRLQTRSRDLVAEHSGSMMNYSSHVMLIPGLDFGLVMLSNTGNITNLLQYLSEEIVFQVLEEKRLVPTDYYTPPRTPPTNDRSADNSLRRFISKDGIIELDSRKSEIRSDNQDRKIDLISLSDGWYGIWSGGQPVTTRIAEKTVNGHNVMIAQNNGRTKRIGSQIRLNENLFNWDRHFGDYEVINPDENFPVTDVRLFRQDGVTYFCYRMPQLSDQMIFLPITAVSENEAVTQGLGRARGETVLSEVIDNELHLTYSGFVAKKISSP